MEPLVLSTTIVVPASPKLVWDTLTDVPSWPDWCPPVRRVVHFQGLEVGKRMAYVLGMGPGVPVSFDVELQTVDPPSVLQWTSTKWWGVRGTRAFRLTQGSEGTRVEDRKTFESKVWPVAALYPKALVRDMSDGWLEGLVLEVARRAR